MISVFLRPVDRLTLNWRGVRDAIGAIFHGVIVDLATLRPAFRVSLDIDVSHDGASLLALVAGGLIATRTMDMR